jgi:DNA-binding transcriptional MerR regulator
METPKQTYTLDELASLSGLNPRTVRYYIQLELVDPPVGQTRAAHYTWQHLGRLLEIRKLTEQGFSLERVRELLVEGNAVPAAARARRPGDIEVKSHLHLGDGLELAIEPGRAHLTPEQLRRLAREILAAHARVLQEQQE